MNIYTPTYFACNDAQALINGEWVAARPIGYTAMTRWERLKTAWRVYKGELDALKWEGQ